MYEINERGCWIWKGKVRSNGRYGYISIKGEAISIHRLACEIQNGPPKECQVARHMCHNNLCVNPQHMLWGSHYDNCKDSGFPSTKNLVPGKSGIENGNSKYPISVYLDVIKFRDEGMTFDAIKNIVGLKSPTHVKQIYDNREQYEKLKSVEVNEPRRI